MYMMGIILSPAYKRCKWAGLPIMSIALIAASYVSHVKNLILTQGILYAFGGSLVYYPALNSLDEWFIRRKGMAYGVMWVRITFV